MAFKDEILGNYLHERHFLQTVYMPAFQPKGRNFVYMKNHKAACTTVIATLMAHLLAEMGDSRDISMQNVHMPPMDVIHAGKRALKLPRALEALQSSDVLRFTVVRDPVSRTVSAWADKVAGTGAKKHKLMEILGQPADEDLSLSAFLDLLAQDPVALDVDRHWRPQSKEISWGLVNYDVVGTTDDLDPALEEIVLKCFNEKKPMVQDTRASLGHKTAANDMVQSLTKKDRRNIERAFGADLEMYEAVKSQQIQTVLAL
ncbi:MULTISPECIES: sulfotransferase family 2 domain-containing protein [Rhodobacterales]|uniref:sulfotransferase family 2 domain-containing protein n=1 Tax=Roseobacter sp. N2S TaxID=2663844 RepID=UPI002865FEA6|nr:MULTISPECIES: sulfotransferase family 2 domain-containing protein [Rhodobacterales]MDR6263815.1 hypothetical protein [Roseobacter sp. N2S]